MTKVEIVSPSDFGPLGNLGTQEGGERSCILTNGKYAKKIVSPCGDWSSIRIDLQVGSSFIIWSTPIMVGNQQECLIGRLIDIFPCLASVIERFLGFESQRHGSIIAFAVDRLGKAFKPLHHDNLTSIFRV